MVFQQYNQLPVPDEANTKHVRSSTDIPQTEEPYDSSDKALSSSASVTTLLPSRSSSPTASIGHAGAKSLYNTSHLEPTRYVPGSLALSPWGFQSLAMVLAMLSFIGLVVIAAKFAGRPLSEWPLPFLSINALAAILTTTMRGALLVPVADSMGQAKWGWFTQSQREPRSPEENMLSRPLRDLQYIDEASRGPWGSFVWLSRNLLRLDWDVSVGALITILSAGLSVFPQQLITVNVRSVAHPNAAHIIWAKDITQMNTIELSKATYAGVFGAEIPEIPVSCPTANCTWEPVLSIGVCGSCLDITDKMPDSWMSCAGDFCNYTSSSTLDVMNNGLRPGLNTTWSFETVREQNFSRIRITSVLPIKTSSYIPLDNPLAAPEVSQSWPKLLSNGFEVINVPFSIDSRRDEEKVIEVTSGEASITQCRLWYCLKAFDANVSSGLIHQSVDNAETHYNNSSENKVKLSTSGNSEIGANTFSISLFNFQDPQSYVSGFTEALNIYWFINLYSYEQLRPTQSRVMRYRTESTQMDLWRYALNDLDGWANKVAKSLTNIMRLQNQVLPEDDAHAGVAFSEETYIRVEWAWITYPAVMVSITLLYFLASIAKNIRLERKVWGNGLLPLILFEVDDDIRDKARQACGSNDDLMKEIGRDRLQFNGFGR